MKVKRLLGLIYSPFGAFVLHRVMHILSGISARKIAAGAAIFRAYSTAFKEQFRLHLAWAARVPPTATVSAFVGQCGEVASGGLAATKPEGEAERE